MSNPSEPSSHRILIVDDNPSIHEDFRKILCPVQSQAQASVSSLAADLFDQAMEEKSPSLFELDSALQGQEALAMVQAAEQTGRPYSLAFMDVRMPPGWNGIETISHIWKEYPHIQIVICTAYSDYSWEQILQQLGETDSFVILKKPFDNMEVMQLAYALTKKWALNRRATARLADLDEMVRCRTQELTQANEHLHKEIRRRSAIETALRESEERFHKAFETVPVACVIRPLDSGRYLDVNESFARLCGYSKEEILGKAPAELELLVDRPAHAELVQTVLNGNRVRDAEISIRTKGGSIRQTLVSMEPLMLGERTCLLAVLQDVTHQRQLENQCLQSQKMEAVGQLATGVAHDFNNVLTVIHGYASLQLAKRALDGDVAKAFTQVKLASERAAALTRQLLAFSRKETVHRHPLELGAILLNMESMLAPTLGETIILTCDCPAGPFWINGDQTALEQLIMNLALNARDAMPKGGRLALVARRIAVSNTEAAGNPERRPGAFIQLAVTDSGCGMDPKTLSRIFEPFFTTKPIGRGTGLGLSTVYGIVKQHQGWIDVESTVGVGTTFRVFLPQTEPPGNNNTPNHDPMGATPNLGTGEAILVVEDEKSLRDLLVSTLSTHGYQVVQADSGAEALLKWKALNCKVRLLLTDMIMPDGISGSLLANRLLVREPGLKVIYTSGYPPELAHNSQLVEGINFLRKPFSQDRLLETVRNALSAKPAALEPESPCSEVARSLPVPQAP